MLFYFSTCSFLFSWWAPFSLALLYVDFTYFCFIKHCSGPSLLTLHFFFPSAFSHLLFIHILITPDLYLDRISNFELPENRGNSYWTSALGHFTDTANSLCPKPNIMHPLTYTPRVTLILFLCSHLTEWLHHCYGLTVCSPTTQHRIHTLKHNPRCESIWREAYGRYLGLDQIIGVDPPRWGWCS